MSASLSRRALLASTSLVLPCPAFAAPDTVKRALRDLEAKSGARIGVTVIDTGNGDALFHRENERFLMCSSFKLSLAAFVLARADSGAEKLDRLVRYQKSDLLEVSPVTTQNLATGMRVGALCEAAVTYSDNTAATLLLASIGGPAGLTKFWRSLGDETTRLDRVEPTLNLPDGDKDTTTPKAMAGDLKTILLDDALKPESRLLLTGWLIANTTGNEMLRAGLPKTWRVGDKTGRYSQGGYNAAIDLAVTMPPGRKPILIAAFTMNGKGDDAAHQALLADIGRVVASAFS